MAGADFIHRMESRGILGPQTLSAECTILEICDEGSNGPICRFDLFNGSSTVGVAYIEVCVCGMRIRDKVPLFPGNSATRVLELMQDVVYDDGKHTCVATVYDYCNRIVSSASGIVFLRSSKSKGDDGSDAVEVPSPKTVQATIHPVDVITLRGRIPVTVCRIDLSTASEGGASALVRVSIDGQAKVAAMVWTDSTSGENEIQVLPELFSGKGKASLGLEVYNGLDLVSSVSKEVEVRVEEVGGQPPLMGDNRSPLEVAVELDQSDYIINVHDDDRLDPSGCIRISELELYSREKGEVILDVDVMLNNKVIRSERKAIGKGHNRMPITVPQSDMFREDPYQASLCIVVRDIRSRLISETRRMLKVRSKFDLDLSRIEYYSAGFTNPRVACVDSMIKAVNAKGISISGNQGEGVNMLRQLEAIVDSVCDLDIQYLSDTFTLKGRSEHFQRVRWPQKVYADRSANCIEISIFFASLFEMAGFFPIIAFPTGHAIPGIIVSCDSPDMAGILPSKVPKDIMSRFSRSLFEIDSKAISMGPGSKVTFLLFEGTMAKRHKGKAEMVCDLDSMVAEATKTYVEDVKERIRGAEPLSICNIKSFRAKGVNPILM